MSEPSPITPPTGVGALFDPIPLGGVTVPNRIAMAPMTRGFSADGVVAPTAVDYYRRRALGGTGLILTEGIAISEIGARMASVPQLGAGAALEAWRPVTAAVHEAGGAIMAQLWHTGLGRQRHMAADPAKPSVGPVSIYLPDDSPHAAGGLYEPGRAMEQEDIDATVDDYATAAVNAREAGFDGVEVHAAHGYLIDQFLWAATNRRGDGYAGDPARRARFGAEVVAEIRHRVGPGFPIGLRFSQWKLPEHYAVKMVESPSELERLLTPLVEAGVDFFDASTRRYWEPEFGTGTNLAGWAKRVTGKPSVMVGSVGLSGPLDPEMRSSEAVAPSADIAAVVRCIESGDVDIVAVGRAMIVNPDWASRVRSGDTAGLVPWSKAALATHW